MNIFVIFTAIITTMFSWQRWKFSSNITVFVISFKSIPYPVIKTIWKNCSKFIHPINFSGLSNWLSCKIHSIPICTSYPLKFFNNSDSIWRVFAITFAKISILKKEYAVRFLKQELCQLNLLLRFWDFSPTYWSLHLLQVIR